MLGNLKLDADRTEPAAFSPFGLGVLDAAVGQLIYELAVEQGAGTLIDSFISANDHGNIPGSRQASIESIQEA